MLKKIVLLIKRFILGMLFLYAYNVIVFPINMTIPINIFTILLITLFGLPALVGFCLFSLFVL